MIIFLTDNHMNEYVHPSDNIIKPLTGFTGSNATLLITEKKNFLYTDGRYFLQAKDELNENFKLKKIGVDLRLTEFIKKNFQGKIGMDFCRVQMKTCEEIQKKLEGREIVHVENDLFHKCEKRKFNETIDLEKIQMRDCIWMFEEERIRELVCDILTKREASHTIEEIFDEDTKEVQQEQLSVNPSKPEDKAMKDILAKWNLFEKTDSSSISTMSVVDEVMKGDITGLAYEEKLFLVKSSLKDDECMILSSMDEIAYLLNLRGTDIPYNLLFYSYLFIEKNRTVLFSDDENIKRKVELREYDEFDAFLASFCSNSGEIKQEKYKKMFLSEDVNVMIFTKIGEKAVKTQLIQKLKSIKNPREIVGTIQANILDGIALTRLFVWVESTLKKEEITEIEVSRKLLSIKRDLSRSFGMRAMKKNLEDKESLMMDCDVKKYLESGCFISESFESIVGSGANAAIIHYKAGDVRVEKNNALLMDTGSHFLFGTTDITRTLHLGKSTSKFREYFTRVLKGQILSKTLRVPQDKFSSIIFNCSRFHLWDIKEDYLHGTSHGVGHSSLVHESLPFKSVVPHQIFSVEPGVYLENEFGIRIEDVVMAVGDKYLSTVDLSYVPIQRCLIKKRMLKSEETKYLNEYNAKVRSILSPFLLKEEARWLKIQTKKISRLLLFVADVN